MRRFGLSLGEGVAGDIHEEGLLAHGQSGRAGGFVGCRADHHVRGEVLAQRTNALQPTRAGRLHGLHTGGHRQVLVLQQHQLKLVAGLQLLPEVLGAKLREAQLLRVVSRKGSRTDEEDTPRHPLSSVESALPATCVNSPHACWICTRPWSSTSWATSNS